ncbi:uncharacterized skeletal organic matrix protein 5-like [Orbicella faveolata]|uniref:uncharacterized skeletal organic matrix protein 5-like n=1 Tax=Orbicella faveolata TaxID=48498 RepID=UPI0009E33B83|nr:uncharacterized skeletal organic matrix protein 5-like [Orbicella faveolata]
MTQTFHYDSNFWSNQEAFNPAAGETGFDTQETKLPTYWSKPFSKICLGMKIPGEERTNFITLDQSAESLHSLIADGQFRPTSVGRDTWKSLLGSQGSLQPNCNREGFNVESDSQNFPKARIGIIGNNEPECVSCDSRIGFGSGGNPDDTNTCGINARAAPDNGDKHIKVMGYILVQ